jgi:hypothetical protein
MTVTELKLINRLNSNISQFHEKELQRMFNYSEHLLLVMKYAQARQNEEKPKMVLYDGKWLTENAVKLMTWHQPTYDTDEEVDDKIWEYIKEKYK